MEEMKVENGVFRNASLSKYNIPTAADVPQIDSLIVEVPDPTGSFGVKGVGKPVTIPTAPAILNAISNAIGRYIRVTPASSERILKLLCKLDNQEAEIISIEDIPYPAP
jgi:CO/xanthine dehydrogenase Mo-binding subunit